MRRRPRARTLVTSLIIGLSLTGATSWLAMPIPTGNAWHGPLTDEDIGLWRGSDQRTWQLSRGSNSWHTVVTYWHVQISGMSLMMPDEDYEAREFDPAQLPRRFRPRSVDGLNMWAAYHSTGWPFPALSCAVLWERQVRNSDILYAVEGGVQLPRDPLFNPRALPLTPVLPGFVLNTLLYGAIAMSLLVGLRRVGWRRRQSRGQCVHCRYAITDLPESSPCPECGRDPAR